jgi:hypothetical protein
LDVYNPHAFVVSNQKVIEIRKNITNLSQIATTKYLSFLETRDRVGLLEKMAPKSIQLSLTPKERRVGFIPVSRGSKILPFHGVPVLYKKRRTIEIMYLTDLLRRYKKITAVYLRGDEKKPFFYKI